MLGCLIQTLSYIFDNLYRTNNAPPIKVLFNNSYGGIGASESFTDYLTLNGLSPDIEYAERHDVELIAAITEFGRQACERLPFVAEDWHVSKFYKLGHAFPGNQSPEIIEKVSQIGPRTIFDVEREISFEEYAKANPDRWMFHCAVPDDQIRPLLVAHTLLKENRDKHLVVPDPTQSNVVFELVGLACASGEFSQLKISTVPVGVEYTINEYDGMESVDY